MQKGKKQSILSRLEYLEKMNEGNVSFDVEYENGAKENLIWGELMCYSIMKHHQQYKEELLTITKIYCNPDTEQYLQIPFAVLTSTNEALPKVIFV